MGEDLKHERIDRIVSDAGSGHTDRGVSEDSPVLSLIENLSPSKQAELLEFAYKASVVLACVLTVMLFEYEHDAQKFHYSFQIRDWMFGIILMPFGGAAWTYLKTLTKKH